MNSHLISKAIFYSRETKEPQLNEGTGRLSTLPARSSPALTPAGRMMAAILSSSRSCSRDRNVFSVPCLLGCCSVWPQLSFLGKVSPEPHALECGASMAGRGWASLCSEACCPDSLQGVENAGNAEDSAPHLSIMSRRSWWP